MKYRGETQKDFKSCSCEAEFPEMTPEGFELYAIRFVCLVTDCGRFLVVIFLLF